MNQNGNHRSVSVVDVVEAEPRADETTALHDSNDPVLKPAKETVTGKGKSWKRSLIKWCCILLLIGSGAVALYLLVRVNRVPVRVQADASSSEAQRSKTRSEGNNSENNLTAEAITIARQASGNDVSTANNAQPNASPYPSPAPSPGQRFTLERSLAFTGNQTPVNENFGNNTTNGDANQQQGGNVNQAQLKTTEQISSTLTQSHANATQSIFIDDAQPKLLLSPLINSSRSPRSDKSSNDKTKTPPAVLPPFGTMLPVRTQGVIFTLRNNSYARMELTRDCAGPGWSLPKGTVLVGRTSGGEYDRAFINVVGYIDPRDNKLVKLSGDVLGADGAAGLPGRRMGVERNRLKQTLRKVASSGVRVAGMMAGALTGRGTVVIDGAGYRLTNPITDEARAMLGNGSDRNSFVKVQAGQAAYVMVADLPKSEPAIDAPGENEVTNAAHALTDREVMELILFGTPEDIRAATPLMSDEQKQLVLKSLTPEVEKR